MLASAQTASWPAALRALRTRQWLHFVVLPAAPFAPSPARAGALAHGAAIAALALAWAYGLNAISDRRTDLDPRKNPLLAWGAAPLLPPLLALCVAGALGLAALAGPVALAAAALSLASATVYSIGPRWKALPLLGTLLNLGIFAPLLIVAPGAQRSPGLLFLAAGFAALLLQNQLLHEQADAAEDAAAGVLTTARFLGERATHHGVALLGLLGAAAAALLAPSLRAAGLAGAGLALVSLLALLPAPDAAARRARHRRLAVLAGALLYGVAA